MSRVKVELRLVGEIADLEAVMAGEPTAAWRLLRQGEIYPPSRHPQPRNVLLLFLAEWDDRYVEPTAEEAAALQAHEQQQVRQAFATLAQLASRLADLDLAPPQCEIVLDTIRVEDDGGFSLPADFVSAAAALHAGLACYIGVAL